MSLASVGKATALGCTVVSTMTLEKSAGLAAPVRMATAEALLDQRHELLLPHPLAQPARWRRTVEGQLVLKELLAAEELVVRVLDPARAKDPRRRDCACA